MRGVTQTVAITFLMTALVVGIVASTMMLADRGSWFWAILAGAMQLALAAQWWLSHREGGAAARTADRFLALLVATLFVIYAAVA